MKKYVKAQLPLLKLRRQEITIAPQKQATGGIKSLGRARKEDVHFFDPVHLFQTILSSASYRLSEHIRSLIAAKMTRLNGDDCNTAGHREMPKKSYYQIPSLQ